MTEHQPPTRWSGRARRADWDALRAASERCGRPVGDVVAAALVTLTPADIEHLGDVDLRSVRAPLPQAARTQLRLLAYLAGARTADVLHTVATRTREGHCAPV